MLAVAIVALATGCAEQGSEAAVVRAQYDPRTRQLVRLDSDQNGDGVIDARTYMAGNLPLRTEVDADGDGRIDRWEYLDAESRVRMVGTSSRSDGVEDRWTSVDAASGERTLRMSRGRDRRVDRREYYRGETLVRADEDGNADGRPDKWEVWSEGRLRETSFDSPGTLGRPDRRVRYDAAGRFEAFEVDPDGDGQFAPPPAGVQLPEKQ